MDLDTLERVLQGPGSSSLEALTHSAYLSNALLRTQNLSIVLMLALKTHRIGPNSDGSTIARSSIYNAVAWLQVSPAIAQLRKLRNLNIWIDHDSATTWTVVNERAILSPLVELAHTHTMNISIILPKLHPGYETPERHFTPHSPAPPFTLTRRLRQRYHGVDLGEGRFHVEYKADFPIMWEDDSDDSDDDLPTAEATERALWKNGVDVEELVRKDPCCLDGFSLCM